MKKIIRRKEVEEATSLKDPTLWRLEQQNLFPKRFKISPKGRMVCWYEKEVNDWLENLENRKRA